MPGLWSGAMRWCLTVAVCAALVGHPSLSRAQDSQPPVTNGVVLVIDQERLFSESAFGRASLERERQVSEELAAENARIQAELVAEEQQLTLLRSSLSAEEFSARAEEFDKKVERIRSEQDQKGRDLAAARDKDVKAFLTAAAPVLGGLLDARGGGVILDRSTVILSSSSVDITEEAIAKVDEVLGETAPTPP